MCAAKAIVRRMIERVRNRRPRAATGAPITAGTDGSMEVVPGNEGVRQDIGLLCLALPDVRFAVEDLSAEDDRAAARRTIPAPTPARRDGEEERGGAFRAGCTGIARGHMR